LTLNHPGRIPFGVPQSSAAALTAHLARIKELADAIPAVSGKSLTAKSLADRIKREVEAISSALKRRTFSRRMV
jgi:hypothetical protein